MLERQVMKAVRCREFYCLTEHCWTVPPRLASWPGRGSELIWYSAVIFSVPKSKTIKETFVISKAPGPAPTTTSAPPFAQNPWILAGYKTFWSPGVVVLQLHSQYLVSWERRITSSRPSWVTHQVYAGLSSVVRPSLKNTRTKKLGVVVYSCNWAFGKQRQEDCSKL